MSEVTVVGMGNILYRDEGVGVYATHYLRDAYRFDPPVEFVDGATLGFAVMDLFEAGARLLVLDSLLADDRAGAVYRLPAEELLELGSEVRPTAHEVDPVALLQLYTGIGEQLDVALVGMVPGDISTLAVGLTPEAREAFPAFITAVLAELQARGITVEPVRELSVDDVIDSLATGAR